MQSSYSMTSTFTLLMKIVRDLALNRDDPEGREHHKQFVEQQFVNSNARIDRVIEESGIELAKLLQMFDIILKCVDRTRTNLTDLLQGLSNCKQLLLLKRVECKKLWTMKIEQQSLITLYNMLIDLKQVRVQCRGHIISGHLLKAIQSLQSAKLIFDREIRNKLEKTSSFNSSTNDLLNSDKIQHLALSEQNQLSDLAESAAVKKDLISGQLSLTSAMNKSGDHLRNNHDLKIDFREKSTCNIYGFLEKLDLNILHAIEDIFSALLAAAEVCIFGPDHVPILSESIQNRRHIGQQYNRNESIFMLHTWSDVSRQAWIDSFSSGFSEIQPPISEDDYSEQQESIFDDFESKEKYLDYIFNCLDKFDSNGGRLKLRDHIADVLKSRLDEIAVSCARSCNHNSTNQMIDYSLAQSDEFKKQKNSSNSLFRLNASNLSTLITRLYDQYEQIGFLCEYINSKSLSSNTSSSLLTSEYIWSSIQRPLLALLLCHLFDNVENIITSQSNLYNETLMKAASLKQMTFSSDLVITVYLRLCDQINSQEVAELSSTAAQASSSSSSNRQLMTERRLLESADLDRFFVDNSIGSLTSSMTISSSPKNTMQSGEIPSNVQRKLTLIPPQSLTDSNLPLSINLKRIEGKIFKFTRSAQVESLSEYYRDVDSTPNKLFDKQIDNDEKHEQSINDDRNLVDILRITSVLVCSPTYRNIQYIYPRLMQTCSVLSLQIQKHCNTFDDKDLNKQQAAFVDNNKNLTILEDTVRRFVKDVFCNRLQTDVCALTADATRSSLVFKDKSAIYNYSIFCNQAITEIINVIFDMQCFNFEFWTAINEILAQHNMIVCTLDRLVGYGESSLNIHSNSLLSVEWVHDVDLNRHLRSMSLFKDLLRRQSTKPSITNSNRLHYVNQKLNASFNQTRRRSSSTNDINNSRSSTGNMKRDIDQIIYNLAKDEHISVDRMITDYRQIRNKAIQHESLTWLNSEVKNILIKHEQQPANTSNYQLKNDKSSSPNETNIVFNNEMIRSSIEHGLAIAEDILLILYVEVRTHCFYHMEMLAHPDNLLSYSNFRFNQYPDDRHKKGDCKFMDTIEDPCIHALCRDIMRLHDSMLNVLNPNKLEYIFNDLGYLLANFFLNLIEKFVSISSQGLLRMRINILSIYRCLLTIFHYRRQSTKTNSVAIIDETLNVSSQSIDDQLTTFTDNSAFSLIKEKQHLLRALRFYDLLYCSNIQELLARIQQDCERVDKFRDRHYKLIVKLKFRSDSKQMTDCQTRPSSLRSESSDSMEMDPSLKLDKILQQLEVILKKSKFNSFNQSPTKLIQSENEN